MKAPRVSTARHSSLWLGRYCGAVTDTPYLSVDPTRLDANLDAMATHASQCGLDLRPHAKTHKCIEIARRQMAAGAVGLTVATIGEAEVFAAAAEQTGCRDLFIAYPLWMTDTKGARLRALASQVALRVGIDSVDGARRLAAETVQHGVAVEAIVEIDSGHHRTGVPPAEAGAIAAQALDAGLEVVGVFTFPGHSYGPGTVRDAAARAESDALSQAAQSLRAHEIEPRVVSGGSTPTATLSHGDPLTEIRPGVYPFNDAQQVEIGSCGFAEVALSAVTTVVRRDRNRVVVDAGSKIISADKPAWATGFGRVLDAPSARIVALSEHHATIEYPVSSESIESADNAIPTVGSRIRIVPNHVCTAVNLVDELIVDAAPGRFLSWPVAARGRNS